MELAVYAVTVLVAYFLGSIPTGFLVGKLRGIDVRKIGSGNIGATNVMRIVGKPAGIFVLVMDGLKGFAACAWVTDLILAAFNGDAPAGAESVRIVAGIAVLLGHNFTYWLKFRGGKGIATSAGVLAALAPWALIIILAVWLVIFGVTKYVSLASIAAALTLPLATWLTGGSIVMIIVTAFMMALAIYKHRANIQRLLQGTEHRIGMKKEALQ